ncbi:hypothetical protein I79_026109 [Cricetulus griseus]|uniref:Uncharacterized protein n=1 Tax=Cricetulus griseus TaxID=10029 RepID=G3IQ21_CRIGR|nr:hypothetical protein I79_026109 [Cricetulus griseus]
MSEVWRWLCVGSWEEQSPWRRPEMVPAGHSRPRGALSSSTLLSCQALGRRLRWRQLGVEIFPGV